MDANQVDVLLSKIRIGKWNLLQTLTTSVASSLPAAHALAGVFVVPRQSYVCRSSQEDLRVVNSNSSDGTCNYIIKTEDDSYQEVPCTEWDFDNSTFTRTLTSEQLLVCDREHYRALYMSLYMIGVLVASPVIGYLADRFGRKRIFVWGVACFIVLGLISGWLPNIPAVLICRFLIGIMHVPVVKISYILGMESCPPEVRPIAGILLYFPWTIYVCIFSGFGYLIRDWRWLMTVASLPSLLLIPGLWLLDESPHWLVVRGRYREALQVLKKASRWNNSSLPSDEEVILILKSTAVPAPKIKHEEEGEKWLSILKRKASDLFILFRTPRLRTISLVLHLNFFVIDMTYYGVTYSGGNFDIDIYSYIALLGLTEVPSRLLIHPILSRFGRKIPLIASLMTTGAVLLCVTAVPKDMQWLMVTFALLGRMCISISSSIIYLFGSELFPTEVRTRGVSCSFMMSRVGSSLAPFITEYLGYNYQWAPSVVFGGGVIIAGLASMALWDTSNMALPDTIAFLESTDPRTRLRGKSNKEESETTSLKSPAKATKLEEEIQLKEKP
ncbi:organic cation transporter protein-like [Palaemon carinicauda]|uniref:organic cation transporter protein-like n=1 Tax=Palaemon carinicauda TaxID=392227 RepID=UPI0035B663DA